MPYACQFLNLEFWTPEQFDRKSSRGTRLRLRAPYTRYLLFLIYLFIRGVVLALFDMSYKLLNPAVKIVAKFIDVIRHRAVARVVDDL